MRRVALLLPLLLLCPAPLFGAGKAAPDTILEVKGDKTEALRVLKAQGYTAVEVKAEPYTLPSIDVSGPDKALPGHMVVITARVDRTKLPPNLVTVKYQWRLLVDGTPSDDFLVWPDGTKIVFSAPDQSGVVTVLLDVDCLFGVQKTLKDGDKDVQVLVDAETNSPDLTAHKVVVGPVGPPTPTPAPGPVVPPAPAPTPAPPSFPAGRFGLAQFAYSAFASDPSMAAKERVDLAAALAANFQAGADSKEADFGKLSVGVSTNNKASAMALNLGGRDAAVKKSVSDRLYELIYSQARVIKTTDDLKDAYRELAAGLAAVR